MDKTEPLITLAEARRLLPTRPDISTLWRWARKGVKGVRLEYLRVGAKIVTSEAALRRFGAALAATDDNPDPRPPTPRRRSQTEKADAVRRVKQSLGVLK